MMLGRWFRSFEHSPCLEKSTSFSGFRGKTPSFSDLWIDLLKQILNQKRFSIPIPNWGNWGGAKLKLCQIYQKFHRKTKFQFRNSTATDCCDKPSIFWFWSFREIGHVENVGAWAPRGCPIRNTSARFWDLAFFSPHLGWTRCFFPEKT